MLTIITVCVTATIIITAAIKSYLRRVFTQEEWEEMYQQAQGHRMFVDNSGELSELDEHEVKLSK